MKTLVFRPKTGSINSGTGKSCATNLVKFMDTVTKAVDDGKPVDIFYLDFAKAFDKVPKHRLMKKLRAKGLDEKAARWIENWLTPAASILVSPKVQSWDLPSSQST
jgi:hypothetical protein